MQTVTVDSEKKTQSDARQRRDWQPMSLEYVGQVQAVVQGGGGKLSINLNDTGDIRKPKGME